MLRARMTGLGACLDGAWADKLSAHRHLDRETSECAYWHSGYHQAMNDLLHIFASSDVIFGSADTSSPLRAAG